ncbi:MAG: hypothetical protein FD152_845 [Xanthobacteraceae bacterium]|nr:MAG: hypothetical protein FD152_845 [Xanthobacteraceae bacterium]
MTEPSLAIQAAIRARLIADSNVTALVPADRIFDGRWRTERMPCIIIGEGNVLYSDEYESFHEETYLDVHVWTEGEDFTAAKRIADAIRRAIKSAPWVAAGFIVHGITVTKARFLRGKGTDAALANTHAVISVDAVLQEAS